MRYFLGFLGFLTIAGGGFFLFSNNYKTFEITPFASSTKILANKDKEVEIVDLNADIEPQKPLPNPSSEIKAIYATSWSAGTPSKIDYLIKLIKETELNALVIDIKDFSGYIAYDINLLEADKYKAKETNLAGSPRVKIKKINSLIKRLHDENIYVIARITVFQDPVLAKARPDLAIHSKAKLITNNQQLTTKTLWLDHKKLAWIDPAAKDAWNYNIAIAKDAANRGFDELNFDYIRFASDGNLEDMIFPHYTLTNADLTRTNAENNLPFKSEVIKSFFSYLREKTKGAKISADLFGLSTINTDDLGIGQIIEDAYQYFDYVSPMVYASHYAKNFLGYKNPAQYPYEVVKYSMEAALRRLIIYNLQLTTNSTSTNLIELQNKNKLQTTNYQLQTKFRPWLQDFDLGAKYDAEMVKKQIQAVYDSASSTPEIINGFMLWDPRNEYTKGALLNE